MLRISFVLALALAASVATAQSADLTQPLPTDTAVHAGQLTNGLRFFIRRNAKPERRAELRLVVDAGSILEDDAQRGVAHFVEHMAFNGTRRFPKSGIVNFLERVGMRFGADLNASTSFDETVYMLQVPTDSARVVRTALDILEDWAHAVTFDTADIRKERGVVVEEWRTGRDASTRVSYRQIPVLLRGSAYAERVPIGTKENIESFADSLAVKFYRDWYRPDLMSVVAVGDFDVREMEAMIRERFGRIPAPAAPRVRRVAGVPGHAETLTSIETDKEYPSKQVALVWLRPRESTRTIGDFRRELVAAFYDGMMNQRFQELAERADGPFAFAGSGRGEIVRTSDAYQLVAGVKGSGFIQAAEALLGEAERVRRFGFTATELQRRKTDYVRTLEQRLAERDKTESAAWAGSYVGAALRREPLVGVAQEVQLGQRLSPTITLEEVNAVARSTFTEENRVVLVAAPDQPDVRVPAAAEMLATFERAKAQRLLAYVDSTSDAPLVARAPEPGKVVSERTISETGIVEWKLSNGARVLLKPTTFRADELLLHAQSPGGMSLLEDGDLATAMGSDVLQAVSGTGPFNRIALTKKLVGTKAQATTGLGPNREIATGRASRQDIETMLQLLWLRFTQPRADAEAYKAFTNQLKAVMANQRNQPSSVFRDTITLTMAQHHPRLKIFTPELLDSVNLDRALSIYRERFADAGNFTFFIVGSFAPDSIRPLVERYLASLPSLSRKEVVIDRGIRPPPGVVTKVVRKGVEPKATTHLVFTSPCAYSYEHRLVLDGLRELLDIRLREVLRGDKGGTYGVEVSANCDHIPYQHASVQITFGSSPARVDELTSAVFAVIDSVRSGGISDSDVAKITEIALREHETALTQNESWLAAMADADEDGRDQRDFLRTPEIVRRLTKDQLRYAARTYLGKDQFARFTLLPETAPPTIPVKP